MEVLRVPPYPIETKWEVPLAEHAYLVYVEDVVDHSIETVEIQSDVNSMITYTLPRTKVQFDRDFLFRIYDTDIYGEIVTDSNLTVYRPYVDPNMLGTTPSEVAEYKRWEIIARSIIDSYLGNDSANGEGFYNHKLIVQGIGEGTDYFPIWHNPKKILKVYENNVLVYNGEDTTIPVGGVQPLVDENFQPTGTLFGTDIAHDLNVGDMVTLSDFVPEEYNGTYRVEEVVSTTDFRIKKSFVDSVDTFGTVKRYWESKYVITPNNSAIMRVEANTYNRLEQKYVGMPTAMGDLGFYGYNGVAFNKGYDYVFILDVGYKAVPPDVEIATEMLIDDLKCGRNDYYNRFVTQYSTDQFDIKFSSQMLVGTGNMIVDKIINGYKGNVIKPGVI